MKYLQLNEDFPPVESANREGLLAFGGELTVERLKKAYSKGIFPWYDESQPVLWWSPDPRMVLFPEELKISKSMKQLLKKDTFRITVDMAFPQVVEACATAKREGQAGTWITREMKDAYAELHRQGWAQSVEVWEGDELVGGLYGIILKERKVFCGESMFTRRSNASKFGFIRFVERLQKQGVRLIDCQVYTRHLESLGAREIPRKEFLKYLR